MTVFLVTHMYWINILGITVYPSAQHICAASEAGAGAPDLVLDSVKV